MTSLNIVPKTHFRPTKYKFASHNNTSMYYAENNHLLTPKKKSVSLYHQDKYRSMKTTTDCPLYNDQQEELQAKEEKKLLTRYGKSAYLDSFNDLLSLDKKEKTKKPKNKIQYKKKSRVYLPTLVENDSLFTLLTNINQPIYYIKNEIQSAEHSLKEDEKVLANLSKEYQEIEKKVDSELIYIKKYAQKQFNKLKKALKSSIIFQQQLAINAKNEITTFNKCTNNLKQQFTKSKIKTNQLQAIIFSSHPYDLKQGQQFSHLNPQYF